jgi:hypothetical protein
MSHAPQTRSVAVDPLKVAIAVFVVLGLALTAVAGYALLDGVGVAVAVDTAPAPLVAPVAFGLLLLATAAAVGRVTPDR